VSLDPPDASSLPSLYITASFAGVTRSANSLQVARVITITADVIHRIRNG
jgi:hypothetical protein